MICHRWKWHQPQPLVSSTRRSHSQLEYTRIAHSSEHFIFITLYSVKAIFLYCFFLLFLSYVRRMDGTCVYTLYTVSVHVVVPKIRLLHDTHTRVFHLFVPFRFFLLFSRFLNFPPSDICLNIRNFGNFPLDSSLIFSSFHFVNFLEMVSPLLHSTICGITYEHVGRRNRCRWVEWNWKWK